MSVEIKSIDEMCRKVEEYIFHKKGVRCHIDFTTEAMLMPMPFAINYMKRQLMLLNHAYNVAITDRDDI